MQNQALGQVVSTLNQANNVLVTVKNDPSVDELAAAVGLTLALNKADKHATTVFSGKVPSTIEFLQPETVIESTTDSLRDFIIALDKSKADKLRYKVEDNVVRIFITPYRSSITADDLEFTQGDFNVDAVIAVGVMGQQDFDTAVTAHGRILHDATVISVTKGSNVSQVGSLNWQEPRASSVSEMVSAVVDGLNPQLMDGQMATAFLTGVVAETDRFKNELTTSDVLSLSSRLMAAGANQQLIAEELEKPEVLPLDEPYEDAVMPTHEAEKQRNLDGTLEIEHSADEGLRAIHIDEDGTVMDQSSAPEMVIDDSYDEFKEDEPPEFQNEEQRSFDRGFIETPFSGIPAQEPQPSELMPSGPVPAPNLNRLSESPLPPPQYEPIMRPPVDEPTTEAQAEPEPEPSVESPPKESEEQPENTSEHHSAAPEMPPVESVIAPETPKTPAPPPNDPLPPPPSLPPAPSLPPKPTLAPPSSPPQHDSQNEPSKRDSAHQLLGSQKKDSNEESVNTLAPATSMPTMSHKHKTLEPISEQFKSKPVQNPITSSAHPPVKHPDDLHSKLDEIRHSIDQKAVNKPTPQQNIAALHVDLEKDLKKDEETALEKPKSAESTQHTKETSNSSSQSSANAAKPQPLVHTQESPTDGSKPPAVPPPLMPPPAGSATSGPRFYDADGTPSNPLS